MLVEPSSLQQPGVPVPFTHTHGRHNIRSTLLTAAQKRINAWYSSACVPLSSLVAHILA